MPWFSLPIYAAPKGLAVLITLIQDPCALFTSSNRASSCAAHILIWKWWYPLWDTRNVFWRTYTCFMNALSFTQSTQVHRISFRLPWITNPVGGLWVFEPKSWEYCSITWRKMCVKGGDHIEDSGSESWSKRQRFRTIGIWRLWNLLVSFPGASRHGIEKKTDKRYNLVGFLPKDREAVNSHLVLEIRNHRVVISRDYGIDRSARRLYLGLDIKTMGWSWSIGRRCHYVIREEIRTEKNASSPYLLSYSDYHILRQIIIW